MNLRYNTTNYSLLLIVATTDRFVSFPLGYLQHSMSHCQQRSIVNILLFGSIWNDWSLFHINQITYIYGIMLANDDFPGVPLALEDNQWHKLNTLMLHSTMGFLSIVCSIKNIVREYIFSKINDPDYISLRSMSKSTKWHITRFNY